MEIDVDRLWGDTVLGKPIPYDFSEGWGEEDGWELVYPDPRDWSAQRCLEWADRQYNLTLESDPRQMDRETLSRGLLGTKDYTEEELAGLTDKDLAKAYISNVDAGDLGDLEGWQNTIREQIQERSDQYAPIYNFLYPVGELRQSPEEAQAILDEAPVALTVVLVRGDPYLALTGCGMDMSWDICKAYVLLGLLPPLYFCELPHFAGHTLSELDQATVRACLSTCEVVKGWADRKAEKLREFLPVEPDVVAEEGE